MTVWRPPQAIRVKTLGLMIEDDHVFACDVRTDSDVLKGVRPLGGSIEFGECREDALRREFREELQADIDILGPFACFESIYLHEGTTGHEVLFVAPIRLIGRVIPIGTMVEFAESDGTICRGGWHPLEALHRSEPALYPDGLAKHLFADG